MEMNDVFDDEKEDDTIEELNLMKEEANSALQDDFRTNDAIVIIGKMVSKLNILMRTEHIDGYIIETGVDMVQEFMDLWQLDYREITPLMPQSWLIDLIVDERDFERDLGKRLFALTKTTTNPELKKQLHELGMEVYQRTDKTRDEDLKWMGIQLEDGKFGTKWLVENKK